MPFTLVNGDSGGSTRSLSAKREARGVGGWGSGDGEGAERRGWVTGAGGR
jgi:hypothetical protein